MGKLFKRVFDVIFILVIIVLVGYFVLRSMGILEIYEVETGSMEHGIHVGDYVLICRKKEYVVGDIVTYQKDNYYITHRIIKSINGNKVVTKGDANNTEDEEISIHAIVGKVILIGGILNFIIDYKYSIVCLLLGLYLLSCYFGKDDSKKLKDKTKLFEDEEKRIIHSETEYKKRLKKRIRSQYRLK